MMMLYRAVDLDKLSTKALAEAADTIAQMTEQDEIKVLAKLLEEVTNRLAELEDKE
jgi:ribosomal protein S7